MSEIIVIKKNKKNVTSLSAEMRLITDKECIK